MTSTKQSPVLNKVDFTFEELHDALYELLNDFKSLSLKNKEVKKLNHFLTKEKKI